MSDEAHFYLNDMANEQNCSYWALENLRELYERSLHSPKVIVWCAIGKAIIIGSYFFEENRNVVTVNFGHYIEPGLLTFLRSLSVI